MASTTRFGPIAVWERLRQPDAAYALRDAAYVLLVANRAKLIPVNFGKGEEPNPLGARGDTPHLVTLSPSRSSIGMVPTMRLGVMQNSFFPAGGYVARRYCIDLLRGGIGLEMSGLAAAQLFAEAIRNSAIV